MQEGKKSCRAAHGERRTRDAEGVELEAPRVETPKASRGWRMGTGYPPSPSQPTRGFVGSSVVSSPSGAKNDFTAF